MTAFLIVLSFGVSTLASPGTPPILQFEKLTDEHGLSSRTVTAIVQDATGFLWMGTQHGLNRYDGYEFISFRHDPADSLSISDNYIWTMIHGPDGDLWLGTMSGGVVRFNTRTFVSTRLAAHEAIEALAKVRALYQDASGILWIGTYGDGLIRYDPAAKIFQHYLPDSIANSLSNKNVWAITEDSDGILWIGTDHGLNRLDPSDESFEVFPTSMAGWETNTIYAIDAEGEHLWIGTEKGLLLFDKRTGHFSTVDLSPAEATPPRVLRLHRDPSGGLWAGTAGTGLYRIDGRDKISKYVNRPEDAASLGHNDVRALFIDRSGILWVGTMGGLNKAALHPPKFRHFPNTSTSWGEHLDSNVWSMGEDDNWLWIGTEGGIVLYDSNWTPYKTFRAGDRGLESNDISAIYRAADGELWVATFGAGLFHFDRKREEFTHIPMPADAGTAGYVLAITEDSDGRLWMGTDGEGILVLDPASNAFSRFSPSDAQSHGLESTSITCFYRDRAGRIYVGTMTGAFLYLESEDRFVSAAYPHDVALDATIVSSIVEDRSSRLWISMATALVMLDRTSGEIRHFPEYAGASLLEDDSGFLWLSAGRQITRLDPETYLFRSYDRDDGVAIAGNHGAYLKRKSGDIVMGGTGGFVAFNPSQMVDNSHIPPLAFTDFRIIGQDQPRKIGYSEPLRLRHKENFFSITFSALDYTVPGKNQYRYQLEGFDRDWVDAGNRRHANYTGVPPGRYRFKVLASNNDGVWNEAGLTLPIFISPPFWQTWWWRMAMVGLFCGLLFALHHYRVRELLKVERMRLKIAGDLHDDIGSNLSSIALLSDSVGSRSSIGDYEKRQLRKISQAARLMVDSLRDIVWTVDPEADRLENVVSRMRDVSAIMLSGVRCHYHVPDDSMPQHLSMDLRRHLYLSFKEIIHNISRHANASTVEISLRLNGKIIELTVCDDGVGFDPEAVVRGNGLKSLRRRAESVGGTLEIDSGPGKGSKVVLTAKMT